MFILQMPDFIKHVKEEVGGLNGANSLQNTKQIICGLNTVMCYLLLFCEPMGCAICKMFLEKQFITIPPRGQSLLIGLRIQGVYLSFQVPLGTKALPTQCLGVQVNGHFCKWTKSKWTRMVYK